MTRTADDERVFGERVTVHRAALAEVFAAQRQQVVSLFEQVDTAAADDLLALSRWNPSLSVALYVENATTADTFGRRTAAAIGGTFTVAALRDWLINNAQLGADYINQSTLERVQAAVAAEVDRRSLLLAVFDDLLGERVDRYATSTATAAANVGSHEAAAQSDMTAKTWTTNSGNPRSLHIAMAGETVPIEGTFSNGMRFPGDPAGGAENNANCQCSLAYS